MASTSKVQNADFSKKAISRAVLKQTTQHPSVLYPAGAAVIGGLAAIALGPGMVALGAVIGGGAIALGGEYAFFDVHSKTLSVHLVSGSSTANHVVAAVTREGTFTAAIDTTDQTDFASSGTGVITIAAALSGTSGPSGTACAPVRRSLRPVSPPPRARRSCACTSGNACVKSRSRSMPTFRMGQKSC